MKKIIILSVMVLIFFMPLTGAVNISTNIEKEKNLTNKNIFNEDFTHTVLAEYISKSTCPYCPQASSQLYSIYNSDDYDFYYLTIITDKLAELSLLAQSNIMNRIRDLGVKYVPDVYFDGGYKHEQGAQPNSDQYISDIVQCGGRDTPDIDLNLEVEWKSKGAIKINVNVQNNEPEEYNGRLMVYITEIESQWTDAQNDQYHFAVLDIPLDKSLALVKKNSKAKIESQIQPLAKTYTFTKWWFGDITQDNTRVIATVLDKETGYAVQTASATPSPSEEKTDNNGYENITAQEAFEQYLSCLCMGAQIPIDIRTQSEWDDEHIEAYDDQQEPVHWPNLQLGEGLQDFIEEYADKEVIIYCRSGNRSWKAIQLLVDNGFTGTLYHMLGGINAWKDAMLPTAISVHKAYGLLTDTNNGIQTPIDIRTTEEWNEEHIKTPPPENPVNYPNLQSGAGLNEFMTEYNNKEVVLYCNSGGRSSNAVDLLIEKIALDEFNGYIHNMIGGINAWKDSGYPTPKFKSHLPSFLQKYQIFVNFLEKILNSFPLPQIL